MAWFRSSNYGKPEPEYHVHRAMMSDTGGATHVIGYSGGHKSERYVAKTEQVVHYRQAPSLVTDYNHSPPRMELFKGGGVGDKPLLLPLVSTRARPDKIDSFSPKVVHDHSKSSPWSNLVSRDNRSHDSGKYRDVSCDYDSDGDDDYDHNQKNKGKGYVYPSYVVPPSTHQDTYYETSPSYKNEKHRENDFAPAKYSVPASTQPRKDTHYERSPSFNNEKHRENGFVPTTYNVPASTQPRRDSYYETSPTHNIEKHRENGFAPATYSVPASTQPRRDTYYERSPSYNNDKHKESGFAPSTYNVPPATQPRKDNYDEEHKGNGYAPPSRYFVPITTPSRNDAQYDVSYNKPVSTSPPPIITRNNRGRDMEFSRENGTNSPHYNSPRKDQGYYQTIDSAEARRRYGKAPIQAGAYGEEKYTGVIDSKEAARKYNGVFVPY